MALQMIKRSSLPAPSRGKGAVTVPALTITELGVFRVNAAWVAAMGTGVGLGLSYDEATRTVALVNYTALPKGVEEADLFQVKTSKDGKNPGIGGLAPFLRQVGYKYNESGNQHFAIKLQDSKAGKACTFTLPEGSLTAPPKQARTRKPKTPANAPTPVVAPSEADLLG